MILLVDGCVECFILILSKSARLHFYTIFLELLSLIANCAAYGTIIGEKFGGGIGSAFEETGGGAWYFSGGRTSQDTLVRVNGGGGGGPDYLQRAPAGHAGCRR